MLSRLRKKRADRALVAAVQAGDLQAAAKALRAGADPEQIADDDLPLPVLAIARGDSACLALLLEAGASPMPATPDYGLLALANPAAALELVTCLLRAGLDPNRDAGRYFFHILKHFDEARATLLLTRLMDYGGSIDVRDRDGRTPLVHALLREQMQLATTLISAGAALPADLDRLPCSDDIKALARRTAEDLRIRKLLQGQ